MAAVKRVLSKFRRGSNDEAFETGDTSPPIVVDGVTETEHLDSAPPNETRDEIDGPQDLDALANVEEDEGQDRPYAWVGLAVASLAGLGAAVYKLFQYRKEQKAAKKDEPWKVPEKQTRLPDDSGTGSLVGLVFLTVVNALGKRVERDHWE